MHLSRRTELNEPPIITTKFGHEPWPLSLIITFEGNKFTYTPRSDFLVLRRTLPRMAVEVNSGRPQQDVLGYGVLDHRRLMLQGASIVRLANQYLDTYKEEKNFFFVAIYIGHNGEAMRHIMYQTMDSPTVYCKNQKFDLKKSESRAQFVLELYNFASVLDAEHDDEVVADQVEGFNNKVNGHPMFKFTDSTTTGNASRATSKGTSKGKGDNRGNQDHPKDDSGRAMEQEEQLKAHGYIVVPDILETDGGTWELLTKPPPHVRIVYRQGDPNKTEMISKAVREASREPDILNFLRSGSFYRRCSLSTNDS
ncbi:hypothetical protein EI94DRAFT_567713 [Lactarius quietus]|nr:hypothetical protein EI94DRAFT_567713 [Lactarius quietus]